MPPVSIRAGLQAVSKRAGLCERRGAGIPLCHSHYRVIPACLLQAGEGPPTGMYTCMDAGGRAASGTSRRGSSNSPPLEGCPPGRGGRAAPSCCKQVWNKRPRRERPGGEGLAGLVKCPRPVVTPIVIPASREWIIKPLDSSLRWNDGEGAAVRRLSGMAKGLSGWQPTCSLLVVIPAQAGIQEGEAGR